MNPSKPSNAPLAAKMEEMCMCGHTAYWHSLTSDAFAPASSGCLAANENATAKCRCKKFAPLAGEESTELAHVVEPYAEGDSPYLIEANTKALRDGEPCTHPGCLRHISHPCEGCGRVGGVRGAQPIPSQKHRLSRRYGRPTPTPVAAKVKKAPREAGDDGK